MLPGKVLDASLTLARTRTTTSPRTSAAAPSHLRSSFAAAPSLRDAPDRTTGTRAGLAHTRARDGREHGSGQLIDEPSRSSAVRSRGQVSWHKQHYPHLVRANEHERASGPYSERTPTSASGSAGLAHSTACHRPVAPHSGIATAAWNRLSEAPAGCRAQRATLDHHAPDRGRGRKSPPALLAEARGPLTVPAHAPRLERRAEIERRCRS